MSHFLKFSRSPASRCLLGACLLLPLLWLMLMGLPAQAQSGNSKTFDHTRTGFVLDGMHARERCESCHIKGVFKGTPKDCISCHTAGTLHGRNNVVMPAGHIPTRASCGTCHGTQTFTGARFTHTGIAPGTCQTCHNGVMAAGKSSNHIATTASCDSCHRTSAWLPAAGFDHAGVQPGSCATCHNGSRAMGRSANHVPTASVASIGNAACDSCHKSGFSSWLPARVHANFNVTGQCATCHSGGFPPAAGKPNNAIHANATNCETCHSSTSSWTTGAKVDHSGFTAATNCSNCHNGSAATGKPSAHVPVGGANCISCHSTSTWKPSSWNHTQMVVSGQCASCHTGSYPPADGKSAMHIPYAGISGVGSASCDSCHKAGFTSWTPAKFHSSFSVSGQCATCHTGGFSQAIGKPNTAIHANATVCETCHKSTTSWTAGTAVDHSGFTAATNCSSCHNGSTATGKPTTHIPVAATNCISCHSTSTWKPSKWNHTQMVVTGQCASCHSGAYPPADGKPAAHIPYASVSGVGSASCDSCHKAGYTSWTPAKFHSAFSVSSQCATCHTGGFAPAVGKPNTVIHANATVCETCHKSTTSWTAGTKVDHSTFSVATNCSSCHNGSAATGKPSTHIPVAATNCISCHSTTAWKPTQWNHTQMVVTGQCTSCHSGAYPPADGKPANHVPYLGITGVGNASCDACHKAGYTSWSPGRFHASFTVTAQCATCHTGSYLGASAKSATHIPYAGIASVGNAGCETCHKSGTSSWTPAKFHSSYSVTSQCATCHTGSYAPAVGKPNTVIHANATVCESCHKSTVSWTAGTSVDHSTFTVATNCSTCHNGSAATGKPSTHIPVAATNCISCHNTTGWKPTRWNHTQIVVTGQCTNCHSGAYPPADGKPANHVPYLGITGVGNASCDACHKAGYTSWSPGRFHASFTVTGQCTTCHTGSYLGASAKPATHIPYASIGTVGNAGCETCHKSGTSSWTPAKFHSNYSVSTQCATCHTGSYAPAVGKPNTVVHSGVTVCESCHKSTTSWTTVTYTHSAANAVGTGTCDNCHNGSTALGKPATHIPVPVGTAKCDSCHRSQTSFAASTTMNHSVVTTATCKSCHNGGYTSQGTQGALAKPANHIPEATQLLNGGTLDCNACHTSTTSWTSERMNHNSTPGNGAGWCKGCHQSGTAYLGSADKMNLNHRNRSPAPTDCSQSGCHRPLGNTGAAYSKWN